jgi:hypothetical protein
MKRLALILTLLASPAAAASDTDYPHRDWGQVATLDMTVPEATACIAREKNRQGGTLVIPVEGGNDIDFRAATGFFGGTVNEPWQTFKVRSEGGATTLRIFYRHPFSQERMTKDVARLGRKCLKVRSTSPDKP